MSDEKETEIKSKIANESGKSSMEILSELFSTFDAEPPVLIKKEKLDELLKKHKKSRKKHKKEKKHKRSKKKKPSTSSSSSSSNEGGLDLAHILIKKEKDIADKIKIEGTSLSLNLHDIKKDKDQKTDFSNRLSFGFDRFNVGVDKYVKEEKQQSREQNIDTMVKGEPKADKEVQQSNNKITFKGLKQSQYVEHLKEKDDNKNREDGEVESGEENEKSRKKHKHKDKTKKRPRSRERSEHKDKRYKSSDKHMEHKSFSKDRDKGEHRSKEKSGYKGSRRKDKYTEVSRDKSRQYRSRSREKHKESKESYSKDLEEYKRCRHKENSFYKSLRDKSRDRDKTEDKWSIRDRYRVYDDDKRYRTQRSRSKSRESSSVIDKKKLLEIARRNAINMMKSGSLPGALTLGPQAQEKVIAAIKSGGQTIEELTDFCKTLSKKEELGELSSLSDKNDSDVDEPFHHPFQIKEKATSITMNIKNSVQLPTKSTTERTTELRMQFPVSSGQQHRKTENDWVPVSPPLSKKPDRPETTGTKPKQDTLLAIEGLSKQDQLSGVTPVMTSVVPIESNSLPVPKTQDLQVSTTVAAMSAVDISLIVSQRLSAMRKLQENPHDVQALSQMYKSNKELQSWAESNKQLGQFTGSTGAHVLTPAQLSSGFQAWAKKDQLQSAAPVSGGMGMHLLQKMGWKPGEGLGKEKSGALEPLLLEVKLDKKGLVATEEQPQKNKKKQKVAQPPVKTLQGKHPVSLLGEYASKRKLGAPQYILEFECGPDHKKNFLFKVRLYLMGLNTSQMLQVIIKKKQRRTLQQ